MELNWTEGKWCDFQSLDSLKTEHLTSLTFLPEDLAQWPTHLRLWARGRWILLPAISSSLYHLPWFYQGWKYHRTAFRGKCKLIAKSHSSIQIYLYFSQMWENKTQETSQKGNEGLECTEHRFSPNLPGFSFLIPLAISSIPIPHFSRVWQMFTTCQSPR